MLTREDNEILCRVGPGTLMGNLLRRYWTPALLSSEVPMPDSPPMSIPRSPGTRSGPLNATWMRVRTGGC